MKTEIIENVKKRIESRKQPWEKEWDKIPTDLIGVEPCCCDNYGTEWCQLTVKNTNSIYNQSFKDDILKIVPLLPSKLKDCFNQYEVIEHFSIKTLRTNPNVSSNAKWHLCGNDSFYGDASSSIKVINLYWFSFQQKDCDARITRKIFTLVHELHHAFQNLYQTKRFQNQMAKGEVFETDDPGDWIENEADEAAIKFLVKNKTKIEEIFNIHVDIDGVNDGILS